MVHKIKRFLSRSGYPTVSPYILLSNMLVLLGINIYAYLDFNLVYRWIVHGTTIVLIIIFFIINYIQYKYHMDKLSPIIIKYDSINNYYKMSLIFNYVIKIVQYAEGNKKNELNPIFIKKLSKVIVSRYLKLQDEIYRDIYKVKYPKRVLKSGLIDTENMTYEEHLIYKQYNYPRKYKREYSNIEFTDINQVAKYLKYNITSLLRDIYKEMDFVIPFITRDEGLYPTLPVYDKTKVDIIVSNLIFGTYKELTNSDLRAEIRK